MNIPITSMLTGVMALLILWLSMQIGMRRIRLGGDVYVKTTDGNGDELLRRLLNAHNNLIESAPIGLIMIGLIEYGGAATLQVVLLACTFLFCRLLHACATLWQTSPQLRTFAMYIQYVFFAISGVWLIYTNAVALLI